MKVSKAKSDELTNPERFFEPKSKTAIQTAVPPRGNQSSLRLKNLKYHLKKKKQTKIYTFRETDKDLYGRYPTILDGVAFQCLSKILKSSKKAHTVCLNYNINESSYSSARYICAGVKGLRSVKDLTINPESPGPMTEDDLRKFTKGFRNIASLESLDFAMLHLKSITSSVAKTLCSAVKSLKSLRRIRLGFSSKVMNTMTQNLAKTLKTLALLQSVALKFSPCDEIVQLDLLSLVRALYNLPSLESLSLDFSRNRLSGTEAENLGQGLRGLAKLKSFGLDFKDCWRLTDSQIQSVVEGFGCLISVQNLYINLMGCGDLTAKTAKSLAKSFESLISLQNLSLNLAECHDFGEGALHIFWKEMKHLIHLKSIDLDFCGWESAINGGLKRFDQAVKSLPLLENMKLSFRVSRIGVLGVENLALGLRGLALLKNLRLSFWGTLASDIELQKLAEGLRDLDSLKTIDLIFSHCEEISIIGVTAIVEAVRKLTCLQNAFLDFFECEITKEEVKSVESIAACALPRIQIKL